MHEHDPRDLSAEQSVVGKVGLFFLEVIKITLLAGITIGIVRYFYLNLFM